MIPTAEDCFAYMKQYEMLDNIRDHSLLVARVATLFVESLHKAGIMISLEKVVAGALLHDIAKTSCLDTEKDHAAIGREICLKHGMPEIAEIVGQHVILKSHSSNNINAIELVYYSDKRVNHDKVVSLEDRLAYILERYAQDNEVRRRAIMMNFKKCKGLEAKIFQQLDFSPSQVAELIDESLFVKEDPRIQGL